MRRVVVLGDVMLDVIVRRLAPLAPTSDTPSSIRVARGGSGASLAVWPWLTAGHEVIYVGAAGNDGAATIVREALRAANVTAQLESVDAPTGTVVSLVGDDGQRAMLTDRGANSLLSESFVLGRLAVPFDHLHVSGYVLLDPATRAIGVAALAPRERAPSHVVGRRVLGRATAIMMTPEVFLGAASRCLRNSFANEEEALALTKGATVDLEGAPGVPGARFHEVVITRGAHGGDRGGGRRPAEAWSPRGRRCSTRRERATPRPERTSARDYATELPSERSKRRWRRPPTWSERSARTSPGCRACRRRRAVGRDRSILPRRR